MDLARHFNEPVEMTARRQDLSQWPTNLQLVPVNLLLMDLNQLFVEEHEGAMWGIGRDFRAGPRPPEPLNRLTYTPNRFDQLRHKLTQGISR